MWKPGTFKCIPTLTTAPRAGVLFRTITTAAIPGAAVPTGFHRVALDYSRTASDGEQGTDGKEQRKCQEEDALTTKPRHHGWSIPADSLEPALAPLREATRLG